MDSHFVKTLSGDLLGASIVSVRPKLIHQRAPGTHPSEMRFTSREVAEICLPHGETAIGDADLLSDTGPLALWPQIEGTDEWFNPLVVAKIEAGGMVIARDGRKLGRCANFDRLLAAAEPRQPDPPPAASAAQPVGGGDAGGTPVAAEPSAHPRPLNDAAPQRVVPLKPRHHGKPAAQAVDTTSNDVA